MADETKPGFWGWAQKHWILTFLLAGSAIALPVKLVAAAKTPATPAAPAAAGPAPPFKAGDVVTVDPKLIAGAISVAAVLPDPTSPFSVRIDNLIGVTSVVDSTPNANNFMGTVVAPTVGNASVPIPKSAVTGVVSRA